MNVDFICATINALLDELDRVWLNVHADRTARIPAPRPDVIYKIAKKITFFSAQATQVGPTNGNEGLSIVNPRYRAKSFDLIPMATNRDVIYYHCVCKVILN